MPKPIDGLAQVLRILVAEGSIQFSRIGRRAWRELQPLESSGVLTRHKAGAGSRLVVARADGLARFTARHFPSGLEQWAEPPGDRERGIAYTRDSKRFRKSEELHIALRALRGVRLVTPENQMLDVGAWCQTAGDAGISVTKANASSWRFSGSLAVVENRRVFSRIAKVLPDHQLIVWAPGSIADIALEWLAALAGQGAKIIHVGDYDPVGLYQFHKLHELCEGKVSLHMPAELDGLFHRLSNRKLLEKEGSIRLLYSLRSFEHPDVQRVISLIDEYNAGLEQEALLLPY